MAESIFSRSFLNAVVWETAETDNKVVLVSLQLRLPHNRTACVEEIAVSSWSFKRKTFKLAVLFYL